MEKERNSMKLETKLLLLTCVAGTALITGCANTQRSNLYILYPAQTESKELAASAKLKESTIAIGKVSIPSYLERPLVVTKVNEHELSYSEFRRWAGSLRENIRHVVHLDIADSLSSDNVVESRLVYGSDTDYIIDINILDMSGTLGEKANLDVRWSIHSKAKDSKVITDTEHLSVELTQPGYDAYVIAQSRMLAELCNKISQVLVKTVK
jgi:uncharacterized lipoprotein YmbA